MAYCIHCGNKLGDNVNFCSSCGKRAIDPIKFEETKDKKTVMKCFTVFGNIGHALGIVTLVLSFVPIFNLYAFICGIHGIVFSVLGKKDETQIEKCNKGLRRSIVGSILGIILFIVFIVLIVGLSD